MKIIVFGAGGITGRAVVEQAKAQGHDIVASEYDTPFATPPSRHVERETADVMNDRLRAEIEGCDAVISTIGVSLSLQTAFDPPPLYTEGTLNIVNAMGAAGVDRLVVISATFVDNRDVIPLWFRLSGMNPLRQVYRQMHDMERILRARGDLAWTAVRPGWLLDLPKTEDYIVREDAIEPGTLRTRHADLAHFMLHCATGEDWVRATPAISRRESARYESPIALIDEFR